jgi:peptidoglycan hydrolase CwlO-like protein
MTKYLTLLINSASSLFLLKILYSFIFSSSQKENKLNFVMSKIKKLEDEIKEIHLIVDTLEEKVGTLEENIDTLEEKVGLLENNITNKIDNFLTSNYDMINNLSINTH